MSETIDSQLLRTETAARQEYGYSAAASFCLYAVWNSEPETEEGRQAKDRLLTSIAPEREHGCYECPVEGCMARSYPKNPAYKTLEDNERPGGVYGPVDDQYCRFKDFCLKEAWEAGKDIKSKPLKNAVVMGAYDFLTGECKQVDGASFPGGNYCVAPGCTLSAGFSEDGIGGTAGQCVKECSQAKVVQENQLIE